MKGPQSSVQMDIKNQTQLNLKHFLLLYNWGDHVGNMDAEHIAVEACSREIVVWMKVSKFKGIVQHSGKYIYSLSCQELNDKSVRKATLPPAAG